MCVVLLWLVSNVYKVSKKNGVGLNSEFFIV